MRILPSITILALAAFAPAQGVNCVLLGTHNLHAPYANIWGYVAPNGKEYALLAATTGTVVIDCTIPTAPVERGFIPGPNSTWRELNTYRQYCYVSTEASGAGIQVIDLTNPDAPFLANTFGQTRLNNCHTITCDTQTGRIYCNGTNTGTVVFDASVDPVNPTYVGNMTSSGQSNYFHDFHTRNGRGYASMIYNGVLRIYDLTVWPPVALSSTSTPGNFTHNAWTNETSTICVTTDEVSGGVVKFFDISNPAAPVSLSTYTTNPASIPHNAYIIGNLCHVSWYTEGYILLDISDPTNPVEIASYDTWPGSSGGFNGAWGVYPFQPSGNIYISDISTGLYIVRPQITDLAIAHTPLGDTTDELGPYRVRAVVTSSNALQGVTLHYDINGGAVTTVAMTPTGNPDEYGFDIPGQFAPATVRYHIEATDSVASRRSPQNGEYSFFVGRLTRIWFDDAETDPGWTHGFVTGQDDWQRGPSFGISGTSGGQGWADPPSAYSGTNCWGNDLGGPGFNGAYQNNVNNWLQSPAIPTGGVQGLRFRYRRWITVAAGDSGRVLVNGQLIATVPQNTRDTAWQWIDHDISAIANTATTLTLRFELITNGSTVAGGWTLDDFELYAQGDCVPPSFYGTGTAGSGSIVPAIGLVGTPQIGQTVGITGGSLLGGTGAFVGLAFTPASLPAFGIEGLIDPNGSFLFYLADGPAGVPGAGTVTRVLTVPNAISLDNIDLFNQVIALDPGAPGGFLSASNGMRFRLCRL